MFSCTKTHNLSPMPHFIPGGSKKQTCTDSLFCNSSYEWPMGSSFHEASGHCPQRFVHMYYIKVNETRLCIFYGPSVHSCYKMVLYHESDSYQYNYYTAKTEI